MHLQYTILQSLLPHVSVHDNVVFEEFTLILKSIKVNWITFIEFVGYEFCKYNPLAQGQEAKVFLEFLTFEDGTYRLLWNVGTELSFYAA
jgi:hypothetical protein